jgi:5S rRNA maturation endonuclease (ribonuclease M5)
MTKFVDTLKKAPEESFKDNLTNLNLKLNLNPEKLFTAIGIDIEDFEEHSTRISGPAPCHGGDNPVGFCYYTNSGVWRCFTHECHVRHQANPVGLISVVCNINFAQAIEKGRSIADSIHVSPEEIEEIKKQRQITVKRNKESYWQCHNEPKETYKENYLNNFLIPPETFSKERCIPLDLLKKYDIGYSKNGAHRGRIVVPIRNVKGQLVGSSGRLVKKTEGPKWFHWKPGVFRKEVHLFNIDNAFRHNIKSGLNEYILVEGPWDCMKMEMGGVHNSVAVLGRTLTDGQNEVLKRLGATRVLIAMDADKRGQEGNENIRKKLENNLIDTGIINLRHAYSAWNDKELGGLDWGHRLVRPERIKRIIERYTV